MKQGVLLLLMLFWGCIKNTEKRIFLIPKGYEGPLLIIEDDRADDSLIVQEKSFVFDFSESTILKFKGRFIEHTSSVSNLNYFYVDSIGNRKEIPHALGLSKNLDSNSIYVFLQYTQIGENSSCYLISSPKNLIYNLNLQEKLCDSILSKLP